MPAATPWCWRWTGRPATWLGKAARAQGAAESSPVPYDAGGKPGVVVLTPKVALGLNADSGEELWRYPWKGGGYTIPTPLVHGDRVLLSVFPSDGLSLMLQLTSSGPKEVWKTKGMGLLFHSGVLVDGHVYGPYSNSGEADSTLLQCVSWETGEVKWTHAGFGFSPLVAADGKLILVTDDGELVVAEASPKAYKELARARSSPARARAGCAPFFATAGSTAGAARMPCAWT